MEHTVHSSKGTFEFGEADRLRLCALYQTAHIRFERPYDRMCLAADWFAGELNIPSIVAYKALCWARGV